jgi:hypothetical protein
MHWREVQKRRGALRVHLFFFEVADEAKNTPREETLVASVSASDKEMTRVETPRRRGLVRRRRAW